MQRLLRAVALLAVIALATGCAGSDLGRLIDAVSSARTPVERAPRPQVADAESAVRSVLQRANLAQVEAFATRAPELMRETSTDAHYRELVETNRALASAGIVGVALVAIEYGDIRVDGATAEATTYETWRSEHADGSLTEETDRNDYTLVSERGVWKISTNVQPEGRSAPPPRDPAAGLGPAGATTRSTNWSGYAADGGVFTSVTGTWSVPNVSSTTAGADASWVGIGGLDTEDLIQAGTMASVTGDGSVTYQAWIEMLPDAARMVPLSVFAGDSVTVTITELSPDRWRIVILNNTTGVWYDNTVFYASTRSSAEWVQEVPSTSRGLLPLSDFGSVRFIAGSAVRDGRTLTIAELGARAITMVNALDQPLAIPSALDASGTGFEVRRTSASGTPAGGSGRRRR